MSTITNGKVKLLDADTYPNLSKAVGVVVPCVVEDFGDGDYLYHVKPAEFEKLGCDVGECGQRFPLYPSEVEVITEENTNEG